MDEDKEEEEVEFMNKHFTLFHLVRIYAVSSEMMIAESDRTQSELIASFAPLIRVLPNAVFRRSHLAPSGSLGVRILQLLAEVECPFASLSCLSFLGGRVLGPGYYPSTLLRYN